MHHCLARRWQRRLRRHYASAQSLQCLAANKDASKTATPDQTRGSGFFRITCSCWIIISGHTPHRQSGGRNAFSRERRPPRANTLDLAGC